MALSALPSRAPCNNSTLLLLMCIQMSHTQIQVESIITYLLQQWVDSGIRESIHGRSGLGSQLRTEAKVEVDYQGCVWQKRWDQLPLPTLTVLHSICIELLLTKYIFIRSVGYIRPVWFIAWQRPKHWCHSWHWAAAVSYIWHTNHQRACTQLTHSRDLLLCMHVH